MSAEAPHRGRLLTEVLHTLAEGDSRTVTELAAELETDARRVRMALEHCRCMGYLEQMPLGCEGSCKGCAERGGCRSCTGHHHTTPPKGDDHGGPARPSWWRVTDDGMRVVRASEARRATPAVGPGR